MLTVISHKSTLSLECETMLTVSLRKNSVETALIILGSSAVNADRTPGACNGCEKLKSRRFDKIPL